MAESVMLPETDSRRDDLVEPIGSDAPAPEQRITEPMPAMSMSDLLHLQVEPLAPPPDADTFDPPTNPRLRVHANGTDQAIKRLEVGPTTAASLVGALEALMPEGLGPMSFARAPTERLPACYEPPGFLDEPPTAAFVSRPVMPVAPRTFPSGLVIAASCLLALATALLLLSLL